MDFVHKKMSSRSSQFDLNRRALIYKTQVHRSIVFSELSDVLTDSWSTSDPFATLLLVYSRVSTGHFFCVRSTPDLKNHRYIPLKFLEFPQWHQIYLQVFEFPQWHRVKIPTKPGRCGDVNCENKNEIESKILARILVLLVLLFLHSRFVCYGV